MRFEIIERRADIAEEQLAGKSRDLRRIDSSRPSCLTTSMPCLNRGLMRMDGDRPRIRTRREPRKVPTSRNPLVADLGGVRPSSVDMVFTRRATRTDAEACRASATFCTQGRLSVSLWCVSSSYSSRLSALIGCRPTMRRRQRYEPPCGIARSADILESGCSLAYRGHPGHKALMRISPGCDISLSA